MNNTEEIIEVITIALVVAIFLLNTGRALKAIELCKESLSWLNRKALLRETQFGKAIYRRIYETMFTAYFCIQDNTNAITYGEKLLIIYCEWGKTVEEGSLSFKLAQIHQRQHKYAEATEFYERSIAIMRETGDNDKEAAAYSNLATVFYCLGDYVKAKEYHKKALVIALEIGDRAGEGTTYGELGAVFYSLGDYVKAKEYLKKALAIIMEINDKAGEGTTYANLGAVFQSLGDYVKAKEYLEKALAIETEIGDRAGEARIYANLGAVFKSLSDNVKAKEYLEKAVAMETEIGDRAGEARTYVNLGTVFESLGDYIKAQEYLEKALAIETEIGDRAGEARTYANLGAVFQSLGDYVKAKEYLEKALAIETEIGDRAGEARTYANLGAVFQSLGDYVKAKEYLEKALAIETEIGDRAGEAPTFGNLGTVFKSLGDNVKAKENYETALAIAMEIGDRAVEATACTNLGTVFQSLGDYVKAKEYLEKALAIETEIGDRAGEARTYANLGNVFQFLGDYVKAKEYHEKALAIQTLIGDRVGKAVSYESIGRLLLQQRQYKMSEKYLKKALAINKEIGIRGWEACVYANLGNVSASLGDKDTSKEYYEKALAIASEIDDKRIMAQIYLNLGVVCTSRIEYNLAEECLGKALELSKNTTREYDCHTILSLTKLSQGKYQEAFYYLFRSIEKCEEMRGFNASNEEINISFADMHIFPYEKLSSLFCDSKDFVNGLYATELGRARALADLMATQYSTETHMSAVDCQSWIGIENIMMRKSKCICLYISYHANRVFLWVLKTSGAICFREVKVDKDTLYKTLEEPAKDLDEFFALMIKRFRSFGILPEEVCEDRSLNDTEPVQSDYSPEESLAALRSAKDEENPEPSLTLFHKMLIDPVSDLLDEPEIIIVPHGNLYRVPFPALLHKSGKYLSETFGIRIAPSLTTLKLIQDSPIDYHSQTGALIVGDPVVGDVIYNGSLNRRFVPLPGARKEAEMIGRLLDVQPLLGQEATKEAVLERIHSVSLIHFAAHGNAERGEIALSPAGLTTEIPQEDDYLLKMSDISKVQLRAKLVVLSCCHSARGQIKAEGVVGIARAFLGSGARSVLAALWALEDSATRQFMNCFYEHLVRGESASQSLQQAMKWMRDEAVVRDNEVAKVSDWAPFMLMGDDVTFDFGNKS